MGAVFGFALEKSRVFEPGVIVGQMQLRSFVMLKVFLTAVATGLVVLAALHGFGFAKLFPKATIFGADIVGGLVLGAGITLAGACPGTVLAQIGAGYRDAWFTLIGGLAGRAYLLIPRAGAEPDPDFGRSRAPHAERRLRRAVLAARARLCGAAGGRPRRARALAPLAERGGRELRRAAAARATGDAGRRWPPPARLARQERRR
ncbi:MAG: YeeE/YedE thiosulfate transporter family protein [Alphaproteobacteria bacterium]